MEIKITQDTLPPLYVGDTPLDDRWIRIITSSRIQFIEKSSIPELITALNKLI